MTEFLAPQRIVTLGPEGSSRPGAQIGAVGCRRSRAQAIDVGGHRQHDPVLGEGGTGGSVHKSHVVRRLDVHVPCAGPLGCTGEGLSRRSIGKGERRHGFFPGG